MNIGIDFLTLEDVATLFWCTTDFKYEKIDENIFTFSNDTDKFIFVKNNKNIISNYIKNCDIKIRAHHNFYNYKELQGYDFLVQSQLVENYHIENVSLKEFLDAGNISLSSASISFEHENFYYEPLFNLNFFYYFYGFNYLNYYKLKTDKINFIGTYHRPNNKSWRDIIYNDIKNLIGNDLYTFNNNPYNLKSIYEPCTNDTFCLWGLNHISSYTDYKTSVCNLLYETLAEDANTEIEDTRMYGRRYITEKTLKAIAFGEEEIFFMWYGPEDIYKYLSDIGFWFYNSEFYNGSLKESIYLATNELKKLKETLLNNNAVYENLKEKYSHKLENNVNLLKTHLKSYYKKNDIINLIKNGKRN